MHSKLRKPAIATLLTTLTAMVISVAGPANAAVLNYNYFAYAGGTVIRAAGTTISSDLTAQSSISGASVPAASSNRVASVNVEKLANVGVVETFTTSKAFGDGVQIVSHAKTAGVNLLNGLIKADAVETTNTTTGSPTTGITAVSSTKYVNLKIVGANLPLNIPKNYKVSVPGVTIVLNANIVTEQDGVVYSTGYGLGVWLLHAYGSAPTGSTIVLNPTYAAMAPPVPVEQPQVGGYAYGTQVLVNGGPSISGQVGKTASISTPPGSSGGRTSTNTTATAKVTGVLTTGAVTSTTTSTASSGAAEVTNTNETAGINLFDGLITADAVKATAHSKKVSGTLTHDMNLQLVNLRISGNLIPANTAPNTTINVAGLGKVVINEQENTSNANRIHGLHITLLEPRGGLQAGAEVELAVAATWITVPK